MDVVNVDTPMNMPTSPNQQTGTGTVTEPRGSEPKYTVTATAALAHCSAVAVDECAVRSQPVTHKNADMH